MAYNDSGELPKEQSTYDLGGYSFELKVENVHEPGEPDVTSVFAICRSPDGTRETVPMDFPAGTTFESWSVEANETEATVYVTKAVDEPIDLGDDVNLNYGSSGGIVNGRTTYDYEAPAFTMFYSKNEYWFGMWGVAASSNSRDVMTYTYRYTPESEPQVATLGLNNTFTYNGKTVYYATPDLQTGVSNPHSAYPVSGEFFVDRDKAPLVAWDMVYAVDSESKELLVARFAIDLHEADGGPDGPWDEPGDVGPDPEKHYTLTVSVTGASAGSNNGTPLEAGQTGGYGNGGTGGNGGGGGAGASTVIIYEFATNKADNVVQEATAQGPGTGGPGGKGGKGGDGCILIFY